MVTLFMENTLKFLKKRVKHYIKIYCRNECVYVDIINYQTDTTFHYTIQNIYVLLNGGYTSERFANDILKAYQRHVLNLYFY